MSYLSFDNLNSIDVYKADSPEYLTVNSLGAYSSSTLSTLNTRKYHGVLVIAQPQLDDDNHVLLSNLDEVIKRDKQEIAFGIHQYPGVPGIPAYFDIKNFSLDKTLVWTYKFKDIELRKSVILIPDKNQILMSYEVIQAKKGFHLGLKPFLAFRNLHHVRKWNSDLNKNLIPIENGIGVKPYQNYHALYLQFSKKFELQPVSDWYYNIEYWQEQSRGYEFREDLFVPAIANFKLKKGDRLIVSAGTEIISSPFSLPTLFQKLLNEKNDINSFEDCLAVAAQQFIVRRKGNTKVIAGWHWFGSWGRDTFIALPGLFLALNNVQEVRDIIKTAISKLKDGLFPNTGSATENDYNSVDAPLWFFWTIQQLGDKISEGHPIWSVYGEVMKDILFHYKNGTRYNIKMDPNGLISSGEKGMGLTWMDAIVEGNPVTPRTGMPVEINALWYNAVCFSLKAASEAGDTDFVNEWKELAIIIKSSFVEIYWCEEKGYLADCYYQDQQDLTIRPNQIFAVSLPYSPLNKTQAASVLNIVKKELLTPRGLRTLSTSHRDYKGTYTGNQVNRDNCYHQGTVWPWLLGHFSEAYLKILPEEGPAFIKSLYLGFENTVFEHGVSTISEIFDGDEPHLPRGAISQAWSVAELIRIKSLLDEYSGRNNENEL